MYTSNTFQYLKCIDNEMKNRYSLVELNLMLAATSYYDAYGNLLEKYLKYIATENHIPFDLEDSHGKLLNNMAEYLLIQVPIYRSRYYQMKSISRQINSHKHHHTAIMEKNKSIDELYTFFDIYSRITKKYDSGFSENFDRSYFDNIYGIMSPESQLKYIMQLQEALNKTLQKVDDDANKFSKQLGLFGYAMKRLLSD